jgi:PAS domain S-box-containing protein
MDTSRFFHHYYHNAKVNSIIILNTSGIILDVNHAFTLHFGYQLNDVNGRHFRMLYTEEDQALKKPENELKEVISEGQSHDENYVVDKAGKAIWCTGEAMLVIGDDEEKLIVKDVINLQSRRQLQLFLKDTEELLQHIFENSKEIPMIIVDSSLKVNQVNNAFLNEFDIENKPPPGSRLFNLNHPFFKDPGFKDEVSKIMVSNVPFKNREFTFQTKSGGQKSIKLNSKIIDGHSTMGKKLFLIIE